MLSNNVSIIWVLALLCLLPCKLDASVDTNNHFADIEKQHLYVIPNDALWFGVAQSRMIVTGKIKISDTDEEKLMGLTSPEYVRLCLNITSVLKGKFNEKTLILNYYAGEKQSESLSARLLLAAENESIFFLSFGSNQAKIRDRSDCYLASLFSQPILIATKESLDETTKEIRFQNRIILNFSKTTQFDKIPNLVLVSNLVASLSVDITQQTNAVATLISMGGGAVPGIIVEMENCADLPLHEISLPNRVAVFECRRLYSPRKVADVLDAILEHDVGMSCGNISSGASHEERMHTINWWKIFLSYWMKQWVDGQPIPHPILGITQSR